MCFHRAACQCTNLLGIPLGWGKKVGVHVERLLTTFVLGVNHKNYSYQTIVLFNNSLCAFKNHKQPSLGASMCLGKLRVMLYGARKI